MNEKPDGRGANARFWIVVKPRARRERIWRSQTGEIRFETTAPPVDGKANAALVEHLSRSLRMPRGAFEIRAGEKSPRKLIEITGPRALEAAARLYAALGTRGE